MDLIQKDNQRMPFEGIDFISLKYKNKTLISIETRFIMNDY